MYEQQDGRAMMVRHLSLELYECSAWMKFVGVMSIIGGALQALTIVGIIIAWLPIWMGVLLFQSAGAAQDAYHSGDENAMRTSLSKLKTYFIITGVMTLIGLIIGAVFLLIGVMGTGFSFMSHFRR
ncbi:MAG: DUF5362 domain-containing protein [Sedimentisphaerales bacterium]|nr:DUF5362 domain-containing protein [Sedimentisphaerales bacterium]